LGGSILAIGFIGMIITGSIVIQDIANNNLTPNGYPKTAILGISLFITIFGVFLFSRDGCNGFKEKTKKNIFELFFSNRNILISCQNSTF
jgi:hypothetical protein